jgi:hypothetical protein
MHLSGLTGLCFVPDLSDFSSVRCGLPSQKQRKLRLRF